MSLPADFDVRERVREANDIVDVVGASLELRRQGSSFVARCPWHDDKKPSLSVNPVRQSWKCWPCDIGGDVFSFVMRRDGVSFPEALKILADRAGIEIQRGSAPAEKGSVDDKATLLSALKWAEERFFNYLAKSPAAAVVRDYLQERGIDEENRIRFRIGFAPDQWDWLLGAALDAGFSPQILQAAGLALARNSGSGHYDFFRGRLMFPIYDLQDRPIAFGGRHVPMIGDQSGGKYVNTSETKLFSKSQHLYALNMARQAMQRQRQALVMEGYTDVIAARQHGIETAVACLGVAVGDSHVRLLKRFVDQIVLVLDGDAAGQRRADEVLELFVSADVDMRVLTLPQGQDPADFLNTHGADAFRELIAQAPDAIEHKLNRSTAGIDLVRDTHAASAALDSMLRLVAKSPQNANNLRIEQTVMRLSRTFGLPADTLKNRITEHRNDPRQNREFKRQPEPTTAPPPQVRHQPITGIDRELFELMIERADLVPQALESVEPRWLATDTARALMTIYEDLELGGHELDVQNVLLAVEDAHLKSVLVNFQQSVDDKAATVNGPPEVRMQAVIDRFRGTELEEQRRRTLRDLESSQLDDDEEMELLKQMFAQERTRQGLLAPPPSE
ncbi:DNA primase [Rosistilla carotiformis]|uniref:DNA primase n=1 Tax=Rosistilla carotiformis TaxID=2528017 RepID=A0A518JW41_9BACT|nr:DNA primase [Rosistilla carotiformis]QDV69759.1 DNA primase [Rosistilla carotiformis]